MKNLGIITSRFNLSEMLKRAIWENKNNIGQNTGFMERKEDHWGMSKGKIKLLSVLSII